MRGGRGGGFGRRPLYRGRHYRSVLWGGGRWMWFPWFAGLGGMLFLLVLMRLIAR